MTAVSEAENYTVVFTGPYPGKAAGEYLYLSDGEGGEPVRGRPPAGRLEREVEFSELPYRMRRSALEEYRKLWNL